jgi:hypothetical protein
MTKQRDVLLSAAAERFRAKLVEARSKRPWNLRAIRLGNARYLTGFRGGVAWVSTAGGRILATMFFVSERSSRTRGREE